MKTFDEVRKKYLPILEAKLRERASFGSFNYEMVCYHLQTGGKRLRGLIPFLIAESFEDSIEIEPQAALPFAAAIEMLHNATLVHDDLQDKDEYRRSLPTVWKKYSAAQAINCGNAMFQRAIELVFDLERNGIDTSVQACLISQMIQYTQQVIEGQAQEFVLKAEQTPGLTRYFEVVEGKTSGLFLLPILGSLEVLGLQEQRCRGVAKKFGILFQILDDWQDLYGEKGRQSKGQDIIEGKISFFVAAFFDHANAKDRDLLKEALINNDIQAALNLFSKYDLESFSQNRINLLRFEIESEIDFLSKPMQHAYRELLGAVFGKKSGIRPLRFNQGPTQSL